MKTIDLQALVQAVEHLIQRNTDLHAQNQLLREERGQLFEKNDIAKENIVAMISRLKALEQDL